MQVALGPITAAKFSLSVILSDKVPPERYTMEISGKGPVGYTRGTAHVELAEQDAENTRMSYRANLQGWPAAPRFGGQDVDQKGTRGAERRAREAPGQ
jgi:carbon monoxide dehydrogenase subunit G